MDLTKEELGILEDLVQKEMVRFHRFHQDCASDMMDAVFLAGKPLAILKNKIYNLRLKERNKIEE